MVYNTYQLGNNMNQVKKLTIMNNASFFNKTMLAQVMDIKENALSENIKRWLKKGILIRLKNGFYVTKEYYQSISEKQAYVEFVANILKKPSYLSTEYVLQKYGILSESVFAITSITRKKTRMYINPIGTFLYSNIKDELFTGYRIVNRGGFDIKEASKAKALFDFFYLRLYQAKIINREWIESFRLNLDEVTKSDFVEFDSYIRLTKMRKFSELTGLLKEIQNDR